MIILNKIIDMKCQINNWKKSGLTVGFVPTMGYLHEGHLSLVRRSAAENDRTVVSIYVNPAQFAPNEDLADYPRNFEMDAGLCEINGVHLVFFPDNDEMYGENYATFVEAGKLAENLCGKSRPEHFRGVCTVVCKLLNIVSPDRAYFGQKDAQQLAVIKRMVRDLDMDAEVIGCPIVREPDGLAMSSRNAYLSPEERKAAAVLSRAVFAGERLVRGGERDAERLIAEMTGIIQTEPSVRIDYVEAVDAGNIAKINGLKGQVLVAAAIFIGRTRLIDNFIAKVE